LNRKLSSGRRSTGGIELAEKHDGASKKRGEGKQDWNIPYGPTGAKRKFHALLQVSATGLKKYEIAATLPERGTVRVVLS